MYAEKLFISLSLSNPTGSPDCAHLCVEQTEMKKGDPALSQEFSLKFFDFSENKDTDLPRKKKK